VKRMTKYINNGIDLKKKFDACNGCLMSSPLSHLKHGLPSGKIEGEEFVALNPTRPDYNAGSFRINIKTGRWADFATHDRGGDLISLYAYLNNCSQLKALQSLSKTIRGDRHGLK
jgi:putative DNA primase/helicase